MVLFSVIVKFYENLKKPYLENDETMNNITNDLVIFVRISKIM